jgi:hypothetical protein
MRAGAGAKAERWTVWGAGRWLSSGLTLFVTGGFLLSDGVRAGCGDSMTLGESTYLIYRDWLPGSGEELRDHPLFFHYLSIFPETPLEEWQTDIYVPLQ